MAKSEFAFATVKTVKPLTIQLDGDTTVIPAVTYAVTVKVNQRVEVRLRKPPQPPLITRVLTPQQSSTSFVVLDNTNRHVTVTAPGDISNSALSDLSTVSLVSASDGFTVAGEAVAVDSDLYPDGTVFAVNALVLGSTDSDRTDATACVLVGGAVGGGYIFATLFPEADGTASTTYNYGSTCLATVSSGALSIGLQAVIKATNITDPVATLTGSVTVQIAMSPLLVSGGTP